MADNPFEIPQALRDVSEQNLKQAHAAYEQLTDFVTKAMGAWMGAMPASPMAAGFKDVQDRAMEIAKKNADSAFALVEKISQGTELSRDCDASDAVCSRPDEGVHHANAGALQADRGGFPEAATRLIFPSTRDASYGGKKGAREAHPTTGGAGFRITAESAGSVRRTENSRSCRWTSSARTTRAGASAAKPPYRLALLSNSRV